MTTNQKYINAVFNFDAETFKTLLNTEPFDESLLQDIKFSEEVPCPIYWMTQCWEIIFAHPEAWKEDCRQIIEENKQRNLEIKRLFEEKLNVVFKPIDFYNTDFWFYRNERDDTSEDVFLFETKENLIAKGYREIDLDLFVAVHKFDFEETERLLKLGANPSCEIAEEGSFCYDRIGSECDFLGSGLQGIYIHRDQCDPFEDNARDLIDLVGWAAHKSMYSLLLKYDTSEDG